MKGAVPKENGHTLSAEVFVAKNQPIITGIQAVRSEQMKNEGLLQKCVQCVLDNFELSYGPLTNECKTEILRKPRSFMVKHCLDFLACFFIITPCIIAFWRGTWDYATIYLEKKAFHVRYSSFNYQSRRSLKSNSKRTNAFLVKSNEFQRICLF